MKKFRKEVVVVFEGEIYDDKKTEDDIINSVTVRFYNWWNYKNRWFYGGVPSEHVRQGQVTKIIINGLEILE